MKHQLLKHKMKWSKTSKLHATKLVIRSCFLLTALVLYIFDRIHGEFELFSNKMFSTIAIICILIVYFIEMVLRFLPNKIESMGCQKIFKSNYVKPNDVEVERKPKFEKSVLVVFVVWVLFNLIFGILYWTHVIDAGILILLSLTYGICDMICILFFCPFQTWFMKNKCCNTCLVYNWDFAMMFTPLLFIPHWATITLGAVGLILAINWEAVRFAHPERFYEISNDSLKCINCKEKLCTHKTQILELAAKARKDVEERVAALKNKALKDHENKKSNDNNN